MSVVVHNNPVVADNAVDSVDNNGTSNRFVSARLLSFFRSVFFSTLLIYSIKVKSWGVGSPTSSNVPVLRMKKYNFEVNLQNVKTRSTCTKDNLRI